MVKSNTITFIAVAQLALVIRSVAGLPIDFDERDITELGRRAHSGVGRGIAEHVPGIAKEVVSQVVTGAVNEWVTQHRRRNLDAIELEPRTHSGIKGILRGAAEQVPQIAKEVVGQAVNEAVNEWTTQHRRNLDAIELEPRTHSGVEKLKSIAKGATEQVSQIAKEVVGQTVNRVIDEWVTQHRRDLEGLNELD
ncbi:hypothetical protein AX14_007633 [Amanita brunnescens Koide BX004]|nr:hypothetical protein AX14_007633 [Amanita brunnescens Koide BX004]